jgi:hypothetical protein
MAVLEHDCLQYLCCKHRNVETRLFFYSIKYVKCLNESVKKSALGQSTLTMLFLWKNAIFWK